MKKFALSVALVIVMAAAGHAQVTVDYTRENRNSSLRIRYSTGYGYGYGFRGFSSGGFGYAAGYGSFFGSGLNYGFYPGYDYLYTGGPSLYAYGGGYGGYGYYAGHGGYRAGYGRPSASTDAAGPVGRSGPVADRIQEFTSAREIEEGRRRLKLGDYGGAVDRFRSAVASQTESPLAQAWFAVALAITGDGKNADKALRAAAAGGLPVEKMSLADGFHDDKERARVVAALSRTGGDGGFAAAFALSLTGDSAKLQQLSEKDPAARQLLPKP